MKFSTIPALAASFFLLLPCTTFAQEEPEAVYAKFHRAMLAGNLDDMNKYGTPGGASDLAKKPEAQRKQALDALKKVMPQKYTITDRQPAADGNSITFHAVGTGAAGGKALPQDGVITLVKLGGEWKVDDVDWKGRKPPAARPAGTAPPVPDRKLGAAKEPCVYKPVMTAEDVERCR